MKNHVDSSTVVDYARPAEVESVNTELHRAQGGWIGGVGDAFW